MKKEPVSSDLSKTNHVAVPRPDARRFLRTFSGSVTDGLPFWAGSRTNSILPWGFGVNAQSDVPTARDER